MDDSRLKFSHISEIEKLAQDEPRPTILSDYRIVAGLLFRRYGQPFPRKIIFDGKSDLSFICDRNFSIPVYTNTVTQLFLLEYLACYLKRPTHSILCREGALKVVNEWYVDSTPLDRLAIAQYYPAI